MRGWWENLEPRERLFLLMGGIACGVLLIYFFILAPFFSNLSALRQQVNADQELLRWMQPAVQVITELQANGVQPQTTSDEALLVTVNQSIQETELQLFLTQISQTNDKQVAVRFNRIPFDHLVKWLAKLWQKSAIEVTEISVIPQKTPGLVEANLTFQKANLSP